MLTTEDIRKQIEKNYQRIRGIEEIIADAEDTREKLRIIELVAAFYADYITGVYSSQELEEVVLRIGRESGEFELKDVGKDNILEYESRSREDGRKRVLIVMTEAGSISGHTSLVINWVENDEERCYSLAFTGVGEFETPGELIDAVHMSDGDLYRFDDEDIITRAKKLMVLSTEFEAILLFTHMYDLTPLLAYSSARWNVPVFFYHHADFRFVMGLSIADYVFALLDYDRRRLLALYGVDETKCIVLRVPGVSVPQDSINKPVNRDEVRTKYEIPVNGKLVVSMGADYKYEKTIEYDFSEFAVDLVSKEDGTYFLIIGADQGSKRWIEMERSTSGRARAIGCLSIKDASALIAVADLYITSFPMIAAGRSIAIANGVPTLTLSATGRYSDNSRGDVFSTTDDLLEAAVRALNGDGDAYIGNPVHMSDRKLWLDSLNKLMSSTCSHKIHQIHPKREIGRQEIINCQLMQRKAAENISYFMLSRPAYSKPVMECIYKFFPEFYYLYNVRLKDSYRIYRKAYKDECKAYERKKELSDKHLKLFEDTATLLLARQEGRTLAQYIKKNGFKKIAIYGMHILGECVLGEISLCELTCLYGIDRNAKNIRSTIPIYQPSERLEKVDIIINATAFDNSEIYTENIQKISIKIVSLKEILEDF